VQESTIKTKIVKAMKAAGHYGRRVEDQYSVGFPDLILILAEGPVFFAEVKVVYNKQFAPSPRQFVELGRLCISECSQPIMIGWKNGLHYIGLPEVQLSTDRCLKQREEETFPQFLRRWWHGGQ